jgi:hypothetical protein
VLVCQICTLFVPVTQAPAKALIKNDKTDCVLFLF